MLLKMKTLAGIREGRIELAFRRWKRPTVKAGGELKTAIGVLAIDSVEVVTQASISEKDSRRAGFASRAELMKELRGREGKTYRVALRYHGADPRITKREERATRTELEELVAALARLDSRSRNGAWTRAVLEAIKASPGVRSADLAPTLGWEQAQLKQRVRKLKNLGLTESLEVGYRLSPRGLDALQHLPA